MTAQHVAAAKPLRAILRKLGLVFAWAAVFGLFAWRAPETFSTLPNFEVIVRHAIIVGFASIGMTYVIAAGAIDLSVGSLVALVTVVIAYVLKAGYGPWMALLAGVGTGMIVGLINGALTAWLKVGAFIVTLGTLLAIRGAAKGVGHEQTITVPGSDTFLRTFTAPLAEGERWMLLPKGFWLLLAMVALAQWAMGSTIFGRNTIAVGSNANTAWLCGILPSRVMVAVFAFAGIFFGLSGVMMFSRLGLGDPTVANGLELQVIAAVVIGGASLSGGAGSVVGSLLGTLIMVTIESGCSHTRVANWVQEIITGAIIVAAVGFDRYRLLRNSSQ